MRYEFVQAQGPYVLKADQGALDQYPFNQYLPRISEKRTLKADELNRGTILIAKSVYASFEVPNAGKRTKDEDPTKETFRVKSDVPLDKAINKAAWNSLENKVDQAKAQAFADILEKMNNHPFAMFYLATQLDSLYAVNGNLRDIKKRGPSDQLSDLLPRLRTVDSYVWWINRAYNHFKTPDAPPLPSSMNRLSALEVARLIREENYAPIDDQQWIVPIRIAD